MIVRVSVGLLGWYRSFFIIGGGRSFMPAATVGFAFSFGGFALTAVGAIVLAESGMENQIISSSNRTNALYNMVLPSLFGEMDLHRAKLVQ